MKLPKDAELTVADLDAFHKINADCIFADVDTGYQIPLDLDKCHFFLIMTENESDLPENGRQAVDTRERL